MKADQKFLRLIATAAAALSTFGSHAQPAPHNNLRLVEAEGFQNGFFPSSDRLAAIRLGKALFWDRQLSADGQTACASCHMHAGADARSLNQINPGQLRSATSMLGPDEDRRFDAIAPNQRWQRSHFPLHKLADPGDRLSTVLRSINETVGSQGSFTQIHSNGSTWAAESPVFQSQNLATLQVTPRQAPSVINAAVNHRQGWDGSSQALFNGADGRGGFALFTDSRGRSAPGSIVKFRPFDGREVVEARALVPHSSLASHALGSMLDPTKLGAQGRTLRDVARKTLAARPLAGQQVSPKDSVLGGKASGVSTGLNMPDYTTMFKEAFGKWWWSSVSDQDDDYPRDTWAGSPPGVTPLDSTDSMARMALSGYSSQRSVRQQAAPADLLEGNFGLLAGLAIQTYLNTLISNDSPYDRHLQGKGRLSEQATRGMELFYGKAGCASCHAGTALTNAAAADITQANKAIHAMLLRGSVRGLVDTGFAYTGVTSIVQDAGLGRQSPQLSTRSFAELATQTTDPQFRVTTGLDKPRDLANFRVATTGAMKIPSLRNVSLTAPYFHNGDSRTLAEVVQFYNRGGNARGSDTANVPQQIRGMGLTEVEQAQLVSFLESLTDDRVWRHQAPFDHPELQVPEGHRTNNGKLVSEGSRAALQWQTWSAAGAGGYAAQQLPLPFLGGTVPDRQRVWIRSADGQRCLTMVLGIAGSWLPCSRLLPNQVFNIGQRTDTGGIGSAVRYQLRSAVTGLWVSAPNWALQPGARSSVSLSINLDQDSDFTVQELARGGVRLYWPKHGGCLSVVPGAGPSFSACAGEDGVELERQRFVIVPADQ